MQNRLLGSLFSKELRNNQKFNIYKDQKVDTIYFRETKTIIYIALIID